MSWLDAGVPLQSVHSRERELSSPVCISRERRGLRCHVRGMSAARDFMTPSGIDGERERPVMSYPSSVAPARRSLWQPCRDDSTASATMHEAFVFHMTD